MQQPYLLRSPQCLVSGDEKSASVSIIKSKCGTPLDFDKVWPCPFTNTGGKILLPQRSLEAKLSASVKRFLAIQIVGLVYDTGVK